MTHYPSALLPSLISNGGRILELGARYQSTPLVQYMTLTRNCEAYTYDVDAAMIEEFSCYRSATHKLIACDWNNVPFRQHWDVVIINDIPHKELRRALIHVAWWAQYVIFEPLVDHPTDQSYYPYQYQKHETFPQHQVILSNLRVLSM